MTSIPLVGCTLRLFLLLLITQCPPSQSADDQTIEAFKETIVSLKRTIADKDAVIEALREVIKSKDGLLAMGSSTTSNKDAPHRPSEGGCIYEFPYSNISEHPFTGPPGMISYKQ